MRYDIEKRYFLTKKLTELKSPSLVQRAFRSKFKNQICPTRRTLLCLGNKFEKTGKLLDLPPKSKKQREAREEAKNQLKTLFTENPLLSIRKASVATAISYNLHRDNVIRYTVIHHYQ